MPKKISVVLKTCSQLTVEQLDMHTVRLRHKNEIVRCGFCVLLGDGPT